MIGHDTALNYHTGWKEQESYAESCSICRKLCAGHPSNKVRCLRLETLQMRLDREEKESPPFCAQITWRAV